MWFPIVQIREGHNRYLLKECNDVNEIAAVEVLADGSALFSAH